MRLKAKNLVAKIEVYRDNEIIFWVGALEFLDNTATQCILVFDGKINHNIKGDFFSTLIDMKTVNLANMIIH